MLALILALMVVVVISILLVIMDEGKANNSANAGIYINIIGNNGNIEVSIILSSTSLRIIRFIMIG